MWKRALPFLWLFLAQLALLLNISTPNWDAAFYYANAHSLVFDGDLHLENNLRLSYPTAGAEFVALGLENVRTETGRVKNLFAIGTSLGWVPLLALLRGGAEAAGFQPTGYEWPFVGTIATFSALTGLMAFYLAYLFTRRIFPESQARQATFVLMFATPLLYYQFRDPLYAHTTSALVTMAVIWVWWEYGNDKWDKWQGAVLLGLLLGLAALVRWQHAVYGVLPLLSAGRWWLDRPLKRWRPAARYLLLVGLAAFIAFLPQLAYWKLFYGHWLTIPQGAGFMDWQANYLLPLLFSTYRGLLWWLPVSFLAIVGLLWLAWHKPRLAWPLLVVLALEIFVNASTADWFSGGGYGPRRFCSELGILVLGYAALLQGIPAGYRAAVSAILGVAVTWEQWILLRYGLLESIGGQNLTVYGQGFYWSEVPGRDFLAQIAAHLPDVWQDPANFFANFPLAPVYHWWQLNSFPFAHLLVLVPAGIFTTALVWLLSRSKFFRTILKS